MPNIQMLLIILLLQPTLFSWLFLYLIYIRKSLALFLGFSLVLGFYNCFFSILVDELWMIITFLCEYF